MKRRVVSFAAFLCLALMASGCKKKDAGHHVADPTAAVKQTAASPELKMGEKGICPVMGEAFQVDAKTDFFVHNGKKIYFCCESCKPKFEKDPKKYLGS